MNGEFQALTKLLQTAIQQNALGDKFCLDDQVKSLDDLWKQCDRTSAVADLKKKMTGCTASEWIPLATQIDYMSVVERDLRIRFRSRIQGFPDPKEANQNIVDEITMLNTELQGIESQKQ